MPNAPLPDLVLYGRPGCHLCDESHDSIDAVLEERRRAGLPVPAIVERIIDQRADWLEAYRERIPVIELGDRRLELAVSPGRIRRLIADVLDAPA
jgi:hypothetical protein